MDSKLDSKSHLKSHSKLHSKGVSAKSPSLKSPPVWLSVCILSVDKMSLCKMSAYVKCPPIKDDYEINNKIESTLGIQIKISNCSEILVCSMVGYQKINDFT